MNGQVNKIKKNQRNRQRSIDDGQNDQYLWKEYQHKKTLIGYRFFFSLSLSNILFFRLLFYISLLTFFKLDSTKKKTSDQFMDYEKRNSKSNLTTMKKKSFCNNFFSLHFQGTKIQSNRIKYQK